MNIQPETADYLASVANLRTVITNYVPLKFHLDKNYDDESVEDYLQSLFDTPNSPFKMYGSPLEFLENLEIYQNFPLKHLKFGTKLQCSEVWEVSKNKPYKFQSADGKRFVSKIDVILHIHAKLILGKVSRMVTQETFQYLVNCESRLEKCHDFYPCDEKFFKRIKHFLNEKNICTLTDLKSLLQFYPGITNPYKPLQKEPVVRLFFDNGHCFVLESELFNNKLILKKTREENGIIFSMDYNKIKKEFPKEIEKITFIPIAIYRADHAAVPIVTPSGGHCILALDALLEFLYQMITVYKIFQKFDDWKPVNQSINALMAKFSDHRNCKLLIDLKEFEKIKTDQANFWDNYMFEKKMQNKKKGTKSCRDVGKYGFNLQFLREELIYLELTDAFPDICSYAQAVFSTIFRERKYPFLRTCDLIKAVEQCQLMCLLNRYQELKDFMHTQNGCSRIGHLHCEYDPFSVPKKLFRRTQCTVYDRFHCVLRIPVFENSRPQIDWVLDLPNSKSVVSNLKYLTNEEISNNEFDHFLLDNNDIRWAMDAKKLPKFTSSRLNSDKKSADVLWSLDAFSDVFDKQIYVPMIRTDEIDCVFVESAFHAVEIVLDQQQRLSDFYSRLISDIKEKCLNEFPDHPHHLHKVIPLGEFFEILDAFDVDKGYIVIVPSVLSGISASNEFEIARENGGEQDKAPQTYLETCHSYVKTLSPRGTFVMHRDAAIFNIFQSVVCGINWTKDYCSTHQNCLNDLKDQIMNALRKYASLNENNYIDCDHVEKIIKEIENHCSFKFQKDMRLPFHESPNWGPLDQVSMDNLILIKEYFDLKCDWGIDVDKNMKIGKYRIEYISAWCEVFFEKNEQLSEFIRKASLKFIANDNPKVEVKKEADQTIIENSEKEENNNEPISEDKNSNNQEISMKIVSEEFNKINRIWNEKVQEIEKSKKSEVASLKNKIEELNEEKSKEIERLKKVIDEMKNKAKNTEEMQKEIEKLKKKNDQLLREKDQIVDKWKNESLNQQNEIFKLKGRIREVQEGITSVRNKNSAELRLKSNQFAAEKKTLTDKITEMTKSRNQIDRENKKLTEELRIRNSEVTKLKENVILNQKNFENKLKMEASKKDKVIKEIQDSMALQESEQIRISKALQELTIFISKKRDEEEKVMRTLSGNFSFISPPSKNSQEGPSAYRSRLMGLQRIKDDLHRRSPLKLAKEMVERLISLSNRTEIHQMANYEYQQYEAKIWNYLQKVEASIEILKNSEDLSKLARLPKPPSFSDKFIDKYWDEIKKEATENASGELTDSDCLICFVEMLPEEKTLKCDECGKVVHLQCASKWHEIHRSCPHCRSNQLDPNEYPSLR